MIGLDFTHPSDFAYNDRYHDWWLLIHTKTPAVFHEEDKSYVIPANSAVLFPPKMAAVYSASGDVYCDSFIRFATDETFVTESKLPFGKPISLRMPETVETLFNILATEHYMGTEAKQRSIILLMRLIMLKLSESVNNEDLSELERELNNLRYEIQIRPAYQWTVSEMAQRLHISTGYLQAMYKKQFGISCMQDVLQKRLELAKDFLVTSSHRVQQISSMCGYQSSEHFCRQFKEATGVSPSAYRESRLSGRK